MLPFPGMAAHVDVPAAEQGGRQGQGERLAFPIGVEHGLLVLGLRVDGAEAVHPAEIVAAVHSAAPFSSSGVLAFSTPIMELRVTSRSNCSADQPSVPAGRSGMTR